MSQKTKTNKTVDIEMSVDNDDYNSKDIFEIKTICRKDDINKSNTVDIGFGYDVEEAIQTNDFLDIEINESEDVIIVDDENNFGISTNLHSALVRYVMNVKDIDYEEAIVLVFDNIVNEVNITDDEEFELHINTDVVNNSDKYAYGNNKDKAIINYYQDNYKQIY